MVQVVHATYMQLWLKTSVFGRLQLFILFSGFATGVYITETVTITTSRAAYANYSNHTLFMKSRHVW